MRKLLPFAAIALIAAVMGCRSPVGPVLDSDAGSLVVRIDTSQSRSAAAGASRAITGVSKVTLKLNHETYPSRTASETYVDTGTTVSLENVKAGTWGIQLYLDDAAAATRYYGEGSVVISPGATSNATIAVYATGTVTIGVVEGIPAPSFEVLNVNETTQEVTVRIVAPPSVTGAQLKYTTVDGGDPTAGPAYDFPYDITVSFDATLSVVTYASELYSQVASFSYWLPYFTPIAGSYTGFTEVTLHSAVPGVTLRYTTDGSDPTYEHGTVAGNLSPVVLTQPTSVLKAVSYTAGSPDTVSDIASGTYTLHVYPEIAVSQSGTAYTSGVTTYDFGPVAPGSQVGPVTFRIENDAAGAADGVLTLGTITLTGAGAAEFDLDTNSLDQTVEVGGHTDLSVTFSPSASGSFSASVSIPNNDSSENPFTIPLTGQGNTAPTLSWLTGLDVYGAGEAGVDGLYAQTGTHDGNFYYQKSGGTTYYVTYDYYDYHYWIGTAQDVDMSTTSTAMYRKSYGTTSSPIGESYGSPEGYDTSADAWVNFYGISPAPYVSTANGIAGWASQGKILRVYWSYADSDGDASATATYQWYRSDTEGETGSAISGEIESTYTTTVSDANKWISVEVTPKAATGVLTGTPQRTVAVQVLTDRDH